ncbi:MAG: tetratricopeptide repeat protein [Planctomycetes bacterium]|nr:tetratricopeptide repeat protein [Planctomycetota bacterium]
MLPVHHQLKQAIQHQRSGEFAAADRIYRQILRVDARHADALHLLGVSAHQQGRPEIAVRSIQQAVEINGTSAVYYNNLGSAHHARGDRENAISSFRNAIRILPTYAEAHFNLGNSMREQGSHAEAIDCYQRALARNLNHADVHNNLGLALKDAGRIADAATSFREALRIDAAHAGAMINLIVSLIDAEDFSEAQAQCERALQLHPHVADFHNAMGLISHRQNNLDTAIASYERALERNPRSVAALNNMAAACLETGRSAQAREHLLRAIEIDPDLAEIHETLGNIEKEQGRLDAAVAAYCRALERSPHRAETHNNLGNAFKAQGHFADAVRAYERAIELQPEFSAAHANLAAVLQSTGDVDAAKRHLQMVLTKRNRPLDQLKAATMLPPIYRSREELRQRRGELIENVSKLVANGLRIDPAVEIVPAIFYPAFHGENDRPLLEDVSRLCRSSYRNRVPRPRSRGRIHVGFVSRFFHDHTIGRLILGLVAGLSRDEFHVTLLWPNAKEDAVANSFRRHADRCVELTERLPMALDRTAAEQLDVLIYADVGMDPLTSTMARSWLAPIQCTTWGHPVTTGMDTIDYFLSSELLETANAAGHYTESLVTFTTMPTRYARPDVPRNRAGRCASVALATREQNSLRKTADRSHFDLPQQGSLYLCPQSLFKFHPDFDELLAEILQTDPRGHLVLIEGLHANWTNQLSQRFQHTIGADCKRIQFLPRQNRDDFLRLMSVCDVMLDPLHFGGGNTNYEAFAVGLPVVTLPSEFMRSRVATGLYRQMEMIAGIVRTPGEYVQTAVHLGTDADYRRHVSERIIDASDVLFDTAEPVQELEDFLRNVTQSL